MRKVFPAQLRAGAGEPLLLLHGGSNHCTSWQDVIPLLSDDYDVLAPSLGGHAGGAPLPDGPVTIERYADSVEAVMDAAGWDTAHVAGNSLGGWTAMELGRRGRARSVVALSPAGGWPDNADDRERIRRHWARIRRQIELTRRVAPLGLRNARVRRYSFAEVAVWGDRISPKHAVELLDIALAADRRVSELLDSPVQRYADTGVPTLISWAEHDRFLPAPGFSDPWHAAAPHATFRVLPGVGHVPMYDDPELVAATIRDWIGSPR
ncbi:alpha/beta fold hydrolase [Nocardioides pelophilus]|uniref:alpha/beta fold hydrolase n=1 Tax=Nocardioides pelophilus TaxID=2172019 RepID=UPI00160084C3|nr:alpha/beta fold hydrolase [Nocardioides pelophilus]